MRQVPIPVLVVLGILFMGVAIVPLCMAYKGDPEKTDFNMELSISADIKNYGTSQHAVFVYSEPGRLPPSRVGWYIHCQGEAWKARDAPLRWMRIVVGVNSWEIRVSRKMLPGNYPTPAEFKSGAVLTEYKETFIFTELPPVGEYTVYALLAPKRDYDEAKQYYLLHSEERKKVGTVKIVEKAPVLPTLYQKLLPLLPCLILILAALLAITIPEVLPKLTRKTFLWRGINGVKPFNQSLFGVSVKN